MINNNENLDLIKSNLSTLLKSIIDVTNTAID